MLRNSVYLAIALLSVSATANTLQQLDDADLSEVAGQDGVNLALKGFSLNSAEHFGYGKLTLTYSMPNDADPSFQDSTKPFNRIEYGNISLSRTDPADVFADPYQIQIESVSVLDYLTRAQLNELLPADDPLRNPLEAPKQDIIRILNPKNLDGAMKWNMAYDWKVVTQSVQKDAQGVDQIVENTHDMGTRIVKDMVIYGGGISLAPAWSYVDTREVRGAAFGLDLNMQIGALILRPRGREAGVDDMVLGEMRMSGIKIGPANATMTGVDADVSKTWKVADVLTQPGIIGAYTDANGKSVLHMGIEWYRGDDPANIPVGAFSIDQIAIKSGTAAAPVTTNLGGFSIGGMQLRYLDVVFRNPN